MGKKAVLLSFQVTEQKVISNGPEVSHGGIKSRFQKFEGWKKKKCIGQILELCPMLL